MNILYAFHISVYGYVTKVRGVQQNWKGKAQNFLKDTRICLIVAKN